MNEKQFKIYATISMVLILIFIFNVYSSRRKIEQMERSISYIRAQTNNMENEFRNSIYQLENRLKEANADIVTYQFTYGDLNASKETIRLHMAFDLREVVANAKYYVCYSPLVEENYTEVEANSTGDTGFDCILDLSIKNNYKFKIIEKTKDGGIRQLKHDNIVSFIYDDFFVRRTYIQSYGRSIDNERILLDFNVTNNTFGIEDYEIEKFNRENDGYRDAEINATNIWKKYVPVFDILANSLTIILYLVGGIMVIKGEMTIGTLVTVSGYLWMLNNPLRQAGWLANDYQRFVTSVEKIYATAIVEPRIFNKDNSIVKEKLDGEIEFSNVSYRTGGEMILEDINIHIKPGETVGIIGATGSGKTTLMNLLNRFYDVTTGSIKIDGVNIKDYNLQSMRSNIGLAMQDVFLFSDTIEGNIAYGRPDCSFEEVVEAAKIADAHNFIVRMTDGYDTIVGERGVGLSGGQKQRISLARALLKDPTILILDDTTSAVDMETESQIQKELKNLDGNRTIFIIAHRISSIKAADQILVLDNGRIIETGKHEELLDKKGYYYTVFHHQYGDFDQIVEVAKKEGGNIG